MASAKLRKNEDWIEVGKDATSDHRRWLLRANPILPNRRLAIIQINPWKAGDSIAADQRDRTTDRVERWAEHESTNPFGEVMYLNLFTLRSADPKDLIPFLVDDHGYAEVKGKNGDEVLKERVQGAHHVVAAWGSMEPLYKARPDLVERRLSEALRALDCDLYCVGPPLLGGQPAHSRYWNMQVDRTLRLWPRPPS